MVCHATLFDVELKMGEHNMSHPMSKWQNLGLFINMKQLLDQTTAGVEMRRLKGVVYITHFLMFDFNGYGRIVSVFYIYQASKV